MDKGTGQTKGFCYLVFETEDDADKAYDNRFDAKLGGRNLYLDYCGSKTSHRTPSHRPGGRRSPSPRYRRSRSRDRYRRDSRDRYDRRSRDRYDDRRGRSRSRDRYR